MTAGPKCCTTSDPPRLDGILASPRQKDEDMELIHPAGGEALACLRAMRTVTAGDGPLLPAVRALMTAAQRILMSLHPHLHALPPIGSAQLAAPRTTPRHAGQLVHAPILSL